jgi:hypothetical protein
MQLRGVPPKETRRGLKLFIFGEPSTGKTFFCTQFKNSYFVDAEEGAKMSKYVENINANNGVLFSTRKFNDLAQELMALSSVEHPYETLVIDPITTIYDDLVEEERERIKKEGRRAKISEEYQVANTRFKKMVWLLLDLPMNVIITAHAKKEYGEAMNVIGTTFDGYKKFGFMFDVVIEAIVRRGKRIGIVKKSRILDLEPDQEIDFSFQEFAKIYSKEIRNAD